MSQEISKMTIEETPFLYMRMQCKQEDVATALGSMFGPVFQHCTTNGIPFAGAPTARYVSYGPGLMTIEAGMPIVGSAEPGENMMLGTLHGGAVATAIHVGSYDTLGETHANIQTWMAENSEESAGAPWEAYITDPGSEPDPSKWQTAITHPLKQ